MRHTKYKLKQAAHFFNNCFKVLIDTNNENLSAVRPLFHLKYLGTASVKQLVLMVFDLTCSYFVRAFSCFRIINLPMINGFELQTQFNRLFWGHTIGSHCVIDCFHSFRHSFAFSADMEF